MALRVLQGPSGSAVSSTGLSTSRCSGTSRPVPHRLSGVSVYCCWICPHVRHILGAVDQRAACDQDPRGWRWLDPFHAVRQIAVPPWAGQREVASFRPGRAPPDVTEVTRRHGGQPEGEVAVPMLGWDRMTGSRLRSTQEREYSVSLLGHPRDVA